MTGGRQKRCRIRLIGRHVRWSTTIKKNVVGDSRREIKVKGQVNNLNMRVSSKKKKSQTKLTKKGKKNTSTCKQNKKKMATPTCRQNKKKMATPTCKQNKKKM